MLVQPTVSHPSAQPAILAFDGFESGGFLGGTGVWTDGWSATRGVTIRIERDDPHSGLNHVRLQRAGTTLQRSLDLTGATGVRLQLWIKTASLRGSDYASVSVAPDGVNFITVLTFVDGDDDNVYRLYDIDLSGFAMTANFRIEIRSDMKWGKLWVDDVEVAGY